MSVINKRKRVAPGSPAAACFPPVARKAVMDILRRLTDLEGEILKNASRHFGDIIRPMRAFAGPGGFMVVLHAVPFLQVSADGGGTEGLA